MIKISLILAALALLNANPATANPDPCDKTWQALPQIAIFLAFTGWTADQLGQELREMADAEPVPGAPASRRRNT